MRSKARFIIALTLAAALGGALVWTSIGGSLETYAGPGQLDRIGETYRLAGVVASGSPKDAQALAVGSEGLRFQVEDPREPSKRVWVLYRGVVSDQFKDGREVVVTGKLEGGTFVARRDTLLTKCPSKFAGKSPPQPT